MQVFISLLYQLTSLLLVPVIIALLALFVWSLLEVGSFMGEWCDRRRAKKTWQDFAETLSTISSSEVRRKAFFQQHLYPGLLGIFAQRGACICDSLCEQERLLSDIEIEAMEKCSRMNLWIRIGPMLGLMGTLIPMGPALIGLSAANMNAMATNLVVAFSTTILGLLIGVIFAFTSTLRRHWYAKDLSDIEHKLRAMWPQETE